MREHGDAVAKRPPNAHLTEAVENLGPVVCLYVHVAGSVEEMVQRTATGVGPGGTLFLVGHRPIDPAVICARRLA